MRFQSNTYRSLLLPALLFFAGIHSALSQTFPATGITIPAGKSVTITYEVDVNASVPPGTCSISSQDTVTGSNFAAVLTDDPDVDGASNPTQTQMIVAPTIISCENVTISNDPGQCQAAYFPNLMINACSPTMATYSVDDGPSSAAPVLIPIGNHTVVATVTTEGGLSATCSFNVLVEDRQAPTIICPQETTVTLDENCTAIMPDLTMNALAMDNCSGVTVTQFPEPGSQITSTNTMVFLTATDGFGYTATCTTAVVGWAPRIEVRGQGFLIENTSNVPNTDDGTDFGDNTGSPITHEFRIKNEGATVLYIDSIVSSNPESFSVGAMDPAGAIAVEGAANFPLTFNTTTQGVKTAVIHVYSSDCTTPDYSFNVEGEVTCVSPGFNDCPNDITLQADVQSCQALSKYGIATTGLPEPTLSYTFSGATNGSGSGDGGDNYFNVGLTTVVVTATNSCGSETCYFTIQVNDVDGPVIDCAEVVEAALDSNCQYIVPDYAYLVGSDCSERGSVTQSPMPGTVLLAGQSTVTLTASDIHGNSSVCSFILVVSDQMGPVITQAAQNTTVYCNATAATAFDNFLRTHGGATAIDACTGTRVYWAHDYRETLSDSCGYTGSVTVNFVAIDINGNGTLTSATFRIVDITAPTLTVPGSVTVACNASTLPANTGNPTTADVCATASSNPESTGIWINEIHYDQAGTDAGEFIEIGGPAGTNLSGSAIYLYRPSDGKYYHTKALSGVIPNLSNGRGVLSFSYPNNTIINGVGAMCLVKSGVIMEFLSYGAPVTASNGSAAGLTSTPIGIFESDSTLAGTSLQRTGPGRLANTFGGQGGVTSSPGALNLDQTITPPPAAPPAPTLSYVDTYTGGPACPYVINRKWKSTDECGNVSAQFTQKITVSGGGPSLVAENGSDSEVPSTELATGLSAEGFALYQNVPNPWNNTTLIRFSLPAQMPVSLSVFDLNGKLVKRYEETFEAGIQGIYVDKADLDDARGMYYYKLETSGWSATKKMILVP